MTDEKIAALTEAGLVVDKHLVLQGEEARNAKDQEQTDEVHAELSRIENEALERIENEGGPILHDDTPRLLEVALQESDDPFHLTNAPGQNLIVLMRLYDVLMGLYAEQASEKAEALINLHNEGKLLLDYPVLVIE